MGNSSNRYLAPTLGVLLVLALIGALLVVTGMIAYAPSEKEQATLDQRWSELLDRAQAPHSNSNPELARLRERLTELHAEHTNDGNAPPSESPERTQLLDDFFSFLRSAPPTSLGRYDGFPLTSLTQFALSIDPPTPIPFLDLTNHTEGLIERGALSDALLGLILETQFIEAASERGLRRSGLGVFRRPATEELALLFLSEAILIGEVIDEEFVQPLPFDLGRVSIQEGEFTRFARRSAILDFADDLWPVRHDADRMAKLDTVREPGGIAYFVGNLLRSLPPVRDKLRWQLSEGLSRSIKMWSESIERRDEALAKLSATRKD